MLLYPKKLNLLSKLSLSAMNNVGYGYETDEVVPQDYVKAAKWYKQSSDQGTAVVETD